MKKKNSISYNIFTACNTIFMIGIFIICIFPFLHTLAKSLNDGYDTMLGGITIFPRKFTVHNFKVLLEDPSLYHAFGISILRVVTGTVLGIAVQLSAAYALSRENLRGRKQIMFYFSVPMFFGGGMIPTYILFVNSGLLNNFWVYILPGLCSYYNIMVIRSFISASIPDSLPEAASLDGASEFRILWQIIFPLSKAVLATVALWIAVNHWNSWSDTMYYVTREDLHTLQYKLMQIVKESEKLKALIQEAALNGEAIGEEVQATPESLVAAQVMVTTIPIVIIYPFLQKYFTKGVMLGAVKS